MRFLICLSAVLALIPTPDAASQSWPHPIPARIRDGSNRDLFIMTLGNVKTDLADGTFDPARDELTLKDGPTWSASSRKRRKHFPARAGSSGTILTSCTSLFPAGKTSP